MTSGEHERSGGVRGAINDLLGLGERRGERDAERREAPQGVPAGQPLGDGAPAGTAPDPTGDQYGTPESNDAAGHDTVQTDRPDDRVAAPHDATHESYGDATAVNADVPAEARLDTPPPGQAGPRHELLGQDDRTEPGYDGDRLDREDGSLGSADHGVDRSAGHDAGPAGGAGAVGAGGAVGTAGAAAVARNRAEGGVEHHDADVPGAGTQGAAVHGDDLQGTGVQGTDVHGAGVQDTGVQDTGVHGDDLQGTGVQDTGVQGTDVHGAGVQDTGVHGADPQGTGVQGTAVDGTDGHSADTQRTDVHGVGATAGQASSGLDAGHPSGAPSSGVASDGASVPTASGSPTDATAGSGTPVSAGTDEEGRERLVPAQRASEYGTRWDQIKGEFVDEPRRAVAGADALVGELLDELQTLFAQQRHGLDQGLDADETSTEDLRLALRRYRSFFDRLLSI